MSFSLMFHWTEDNISVHAFTCVVALQLAHLMRLKAGRAGLDMYVRVLLSDLSDIQETVLLYYRDGGRLRAYRMLRYGLRRPAPDTTPV